MANKVSTVKNRKHWVSNIALYNWWLNKVNSNITRADPYYAIYGLVAFAQRCDVPYETFEADARTLYEKFNMLLPPKFNITILSEKDFVELLEFYYTKDLTRTKKEWLEEKSKIKMPPAAKRNGRNQELHLALCRAKIKAYKELGLDENWNKGGRPAKDYIVINYLKEHPNETNISKIARECDISRNTVRKYFSKP